jgi:hypothetical protein
LARLFSFETRSWKLEARSQGLARDKLEGRSQKPEKVDSSFLM